MENWFQKGQLSKSDKFLLHSLEDIIKEGTYQSELTMAVQPQSYRGRQRLKPLIIITICLSLWKVADKKLILFGLWRLWVLTTCWKKLRIKF